MNDIKSISGKEQVPAVHFLRRIYFDRDTMEVISCYSVMGDFRETSVEEDFNEVPELMENRDRMDNIDVLQWRAPDPATEKLIESADKISVIRDEKLPSGYAVVEIKQADDTLPYEEEE